LKNFLNSGLSVWVLTAIILIISLYINKNKLNFKAIVIIFGIIMIFLINYLLLSFEEETTHLLIEFIKFGAIPFYLASTIKNTENIYKYWLVLGILNFVILLFYIEQINEREFNYMTFGRYMSLSFIIFSYYYYKGKFKVSMFFIMLITMIAVFIFGNRSSILIIILIVFYFEIKKLIQKRTLMQYFKLTLITIGLIYLISNIKKLVYKLIYLLEINNLNSYSFKKLIALFDNNTTSFVSGRDNIYFDSVKLIYKNNLMPKVIGYYQNVTEHVYPHNVFFDIMITFGFIGVLLILSVAIISIIKYIKISNLYIKQLILILGIYQFTILNFSGTFWSESIMWMLFGLLISNNFVSKVETKISSLNVINTINNRCLIKEYSQCNYTYI